MRILIINLTRLGDIIQSLGLIKGLKRQYPHAEIDFLAMSSFAGILTNIPEIAQTFSFNDHLLVDQVKENFWEGMIEISQVVQDLNARQYTLLINPVISIQSAYLTYLIKAEQKFGMTFTENREQSIVSEWSAFLLANQHNLGDHAFNLVDIFAGVGQVVVQKHDFRLSCSEKAENMVNSVWKDHNIKGKKLIGFHIGASQSNKAWDIHSFKELILKLVHHKEYQILLFGGYKEIEVKDYFHDIDSSNFYNLIGMFNLDELIGAIGRTDLFITNDTGPMHIAACTGRPVVNISLGPVSMWETGPYQNNSYVVQADIDCHPCNFDYQCPHWNCHKYITPDTIYSLIEAHFNQTPQDFSTQTQTLIWKAVRDPFDRHHWVPVKKRAIRAKELLFEWKRAVWGMSLFKNLKPETDWLDQYNHFLHQHYEFQSYQFTDLIAGLEYLTGLATDISEKLYTLSKLDSETKKSLDKIKKIWSDVSLKKESLFVKAKEYSVFYDWFWFVTFRESQIEGESMESLARQSSVLYYNLAMQMLALKRGLKEFL